MESGAQTLFSSFSTAGQLIGDEYRLLRGVRDQVADLRDDLDAMNALFSMHSAAEEGSVDPFNQVLMKQVRELGYDVEDCVDLYKLRVKCRPDDGFLKRWKHGFATLLERRRLACEISDLRARAVSISERYQRFGFSLEALRRVPQAQATAAAAAYRRHSGGGAGGDPEHHEFVGMDEQAITLANKLKERRVNEGRRVKVFSIVGFGGVGKTTLAMVLCRRLEADFPYQAMVSVSQAFEPSRDRKPLLKRLLEQILMPKTENERGVKEEGTLGNIGALNEEELSSKLREILKDKRYLIVIDDVWTIRAWESIQSKLLPAENSCESRIIVTTRIENVAQACCSSDSGSEHHIHHMKPLESKYSQILFLSRVFGSKDATCPGELKDVMDKILKKCGGLPLAIVSIASILVGYRSPGSRDKWEAMCKSIGFEMESNPSLEGMRQIVALSYDHLPHELKSCMMYLSIFPEDYEIHKDRLLRRWIAEGLVPAKRGLTLMEVAEYYLDELVRRNMVQPCLNPYIDDVYVYRVHDVHLEVIVFKSLESNFVSLVGGQYAGMSYDRIRRLSIHGGSKKSQNEAVDSDLEDTRPHKEHGVKWMDVEHVRSLSMFHVQGHKLLDQLDKFTLLRVLDLQDCEHVTDHHMVSACRLFLLRYLNLRGSNIRKVPHQIKNLQHLQKFNARDTRVEDLPKTITELENLESVSLLNCPGEWRLPRGLSRMKALRRLLGTRLGDNVEIVKELGKLEQLQDLHVCIDSPMMMNKDLFQEEVAKSISKLYSLRSLNLRGAGDTLSFVHRLLEPPRQLRWLTIFGRIDGGLPTWIGALTCLNYIDLSETEFTGDEPYSVLCKLPNLRTVTLNFVQHASKELVARSSHNFPALTRLFLNAPGQLSALRFEEESMPKLEKIRVTLYASWTIVGIKHLTSLKEVKLQVPDRDESSEISRTVDELKAEIRNHLNKCQLIVVHDMKDLFK